MSARELIEQLRRDSDTLEQDAKTAESPEVKYWRLGKANGMRNSADLFEACWAHMLKDEPGL